MCDCIKFIVSIILLVYIIQSITHILRDTEVDILKQNLTIEEKNNFFYKPGLNPQINSEISIKCEMYQNTIMNPKVTKIEDVFNLNVKLIHDTTRWLLIAFILSFVSLFILFFLVILINLINALFSACISLIALLAFIIINIAVFVLLFQVIVLFYYSDLYQMISFLKCENVNRAGFNKYLLVEDLFYNFKKLVIMFIIYFIWSGLANGNNKDNDRSQTGNEAQYVRLSDNHLN